ncbi:hypothetical protein, partial [Mesorhizobium sp.]|uniref:hypothetical protein n=1 Tax=Mesorhizobium sp. TaxID=1871066 RepID=UPI00257F03D5
FSSETDPLTTLGVADLNLQIEVGNLNLQRKSIRECARVRSFTTFGGDPQMLFRVMMGLQRA